MNRLALNSNSAPTLLETLLENPSASTGGGTILVAPQPTEKELGQTETLLAVDWSSVYLSLPVKWLTRPADGPRTLRVRVTKSVPPPPPPPPPPPVAVKKETMKRAAPRAAAGSQPAKRPAKSTGSQAKVDPKEAQLVGEDGTQYWEVERITNKRKTKAGKVEYLVKWKGCGGGLATMCLATMPATILAAPTRPSTCCAGHPCSTAATSCASEVLMLL